MALWSSASTLYRKIEGSNLAANFSFERTAMTRQKRGDISLTNSIINQSAPQPTAPTDMPTYHPPTSLLHAHSKAEPATDHSNLPHPMQWDLPQSVSPSYALQLCSFLWPTTAIFSAMWSFFHPFFVVAFWIRLKVPT